MRRVQILLQADVGEATPSRLAQQLRHDDEITQAFNSSSAVVQRVRQRYCEQGLEAALERSVPNRVYERAVDGGARRISSR